MQHCGSGHHAEWSAIAQFSVGQTIEFKFVKKTDHGVVGYPESADAERGGRILAAIVGRVGEVARGVLDLPLPE